MRERAGRVEGRLFEQRNLLMRTMRSVSKNANEEQEPAL